MREIKFRVWDKESSKFFEPTYEAHKGNLEDLHISLDGSIALRRIKSFDHESLFPNRFVLMQYTGLKDKNGEEIYEGDVIRVDRYLWLVKWKNSTARFYGVGLFKGESKPRTTMTKITKGKIIGNIHSNPELIKENK